MLSPERATIGARRSDELGRYYTRADIGELLVDYMGSTAPYGVLDLGSGVGSLSEAAARRWSNSNILTVDVDQAVSAQIRAALNLRAEGRHAHLRADALSSRLPLLIRAQLDKIDAAVCNPPFIKPVWRKTFDNILEDAGLSGCLPAIKDADAALLFLAQNLRTLDAGATLGIILPDTMISSQRYQRFRKRSAGKIQSGGSHQASTWLFPWHGSLGIDPHSKDSKTHGSICTAIQTKFRAHNFYSYLGPH